jgi:hypothetical protein
MHDDRLLPEPGRRSGREPMKKQESKKLQLGKDTLRLLQNDPLEKAIGGYPTTTVLTRFNSCTC